jgi:hypothetical protein
MVAHAVIRQVVPADAATTFGLIHDYPRRLDWDTLLREAYVEGGGPPGVGAVAVCSARRHLTGISFRTRYVTFDPPRLAAVTLVAPTAVFATWAASIRHRDLGPGRSEVTYTLTFRGRPVWAAPLVERVARLAFRVETARRLSALARTLASHPPRPPGAAPG